MAEDNIIKSVLGFNLKIEIKDQNGEPIKTGARTIYPTESLSNLKYRLLDTKFFTHYNQALLDQVKACRRCS
jgi:hypothetical protein